MFVGHAQGVDLGLGGRVVAVTGASSGIGLATARLLSSEGARVAICARDAVRLSTAVKTLDPDRCFAHPCDVRDRGGCEAFVAAVMERLGRLDGLVNNAGQGRRGGLHELTDDDSRAEMDAKVFGVLNPLRAALPHLQRSDAARVVNISAVSAREPDTALLAVGAARAAVSNLSRALAAELASAGILVNTVSVGVIGTARAHERHQRDAPELAFEQWAEREAHERGVDLGRLGRAEEVAAAVTFLISPAASYITGANLDVAGGLNRAW